MAAIGQPRCPEQRFVLWCQNYISIRITWFRQASIRIPIRPMPPPTGGHIGNSVAPGFPARKHWDQTIPFGGGVNCSAGGNSEGALYGNHPSVTSVPQRPRHSRNSDAAAAETSNGWPHHETDSGSLECYVSPQSIRGTFFALGPFWAHKSLAAVSLRSIAFLGLKRASPT